jgi:DNA-binding NtrC family response regulator
MRHRRILIVDDDPELSSVIAECLGDRGHDCRVIDGLDMPEPDTWRWAELAILDLRLSGRYDSTELLRGMEAIAPAPELILSSGCDSGTLESAMRTARELGFTVRATLRKPFPVARLHAAVGTEAIAN